MAMDAGTFPFFPMAFFLLFYVCDMNEQDMVHIIYHKGIGQIELMHKTAVSGGNCMLAAIPVFSANVHNFCLSAVKHQMRELQCF